MYFQNIDYANPEIPIYFIPDFRKNSHLVLVQFDI